MLDPEEEDDDTAIVVPASILHLSICCIHNFPQLEQQQTTVQSLVKESVARVSRRALLRKRWHRRTRTGRAAGAAPFSFLVMEFLIIPSPRRGPMQAYHRLSLAAPAPLFFSLGGGLLHFSAGRVQLFTCMRQAMIEENLIARISTPPQRTTKAN
jgi:hypothetical protein